MLKTGIRNMAAITAAFLLYGLLRVILYGQDFADLISQLFSGAVILVWGEFIWGRVTDRRQRRLLICLTAFLLLLLLMQTVNYRFAQNREDLRRYAWYGYYVCEMGAAILFYYAAVFCGLEGMELIGSVLKIPMGCACDNVYSGHGQVFIQGEEGETGLPLNKDYTQITMKVNGIVDGYYPFGFRIRGNVDGYELPGGRPHRGEFDYIPKVESGNIFRAKVPRQIDDSLVLEIFHLDDGSLVTIQNLGKIIRDMGYDWNARDLKDIGIGVDVSEASFRVVIEAWEISETVTVVF